MSALLMGQVWRLQLGQGQRLVALALADHADDDGGHIFPGIPYLAWKTDLCERQVRRVLRFLEDLGLIEAVSFATGGRGHATEYQMHIEAVPPKDPYKKPFPDGDKGGHPEPVAQDKGGHSAQIKADISAQMGTSTPVKGDISSPQRRTFLHTKADISAQRGTSDGIKADIAMSAQPSVTTKGNINEPSREPTRAIARGSPGKTKFLEGHREGCFCSGCARLQMPPVRYIKPSWGAARRTG